MYPRKKKLGWLTDQASLMPDTNLLREVSVACDEQYSTDGKVLLDVCRPRRDVHENALLERTGHRWTPHRAVSLVVFLHCRLRSRRLSDAAAAVPPAVPCAVRRRTTWRSLTRSRRSISSPERSRRPTMRQLAASHARPSCSRRYSTRWTKLPIVGFILPQRRCSRSATSETRTAACRVPSTACEFSCCPCCAWYPTRW